MATTKDKKGTMYYEGVGRRKTSVARVRLSPGKGGAIVNGKPLADYFVTEEMREFVETPFKTLPDQNNYSISALVSGGGLHSQAEAVRHGIARALLKVDEGARLTLKKAKLLTRDSRMKERRKFGLKKARRAPQWSKR